MQEGISKRRYEHLKDALLRIEGLLSHGQEKKCSCFVNYYNWDLETMYWNYELLFKELLKQLSLYEMLHSETKLQFLDSKLKELKKEINGNAFEFSYVNTDVLFKKGIDAFGEFMKLPPLINDYLTLRMYVIMIHHHPYKKEIAYTEAPNPDVLKSNLDHFPVGESVLLSVTDWFYDEELLAAYYIEDLSTAFKW